MQKNRGGSNSKYSHYRGDKNLSALELSEDSAREGLDSRDASNKGDSKILDFSSKVNEMDHKQAEADKSQEPPKKKPRRRKS